MNDEAPIHAPIHAIYERSGWCNVGGEPMKPALPANGDLKVVGWYCACGGGNHRTTRYDANFKPRSGDCWREGVLIQRGTTPIYSDKNDG